MWHWLRTSCTTSKTKCTHSVFEGCMYPRKGEGNRRLKGWAGAVRWGERQASSFCSTGRKDGHRWGLSLFPSHNWHQAWFGHSWQLQACPLAQEGKIGSTSLSVLLPARVPLPCAVPCLCQSLSWCASQEQSVHRHLHPNWLTPAAGTRAGAPRRTCLVVRNASLPAIKNCPPPTQLHWTNVLHL